MARAEYHVVRHQGRWHVRFQDRLHGPYDSRFDALRSAIDAAHMAGRNGRAAVVTRATADGRTETVWTYGRDPYPPKI